MSELNAEHAGFREWSERLSIPLALVDKGGVIVAFNGPFRRALGARVGLSLDSLVVADDAFLRFLAAARRTSSPLPGRIQLRVSPLVIGCEAALMTSADQDAATAPILLRLEAGPGPAQKFRALNEKIQALEKQEALRKRAEDQLRATRQRLTEIIEHSPVSISLKDGSGRYTLVNSVFCQLAEREQSDVLGRTGREIFGDEASATIASDGVVKATGNPMSHETSFLRSGVIRSFLSVAFPIDDPVSSERSICRISTDLSEIRAAEEERRELEARLLHAQKLESLGVLAGGIAHDFNNLLMGVLGNAALAAEFLGSDPAEVEPCLEGIQLAAQRAAGLCRQLLAYSGKGRFVVQQVDVSELVREMVDLLGVSLSKKTVVSLRIAEDLPLTEADATQLRQVVMNLVTNASEALDGETGTVTVVTGFQNCSAEYLRAGFESFDLEPGPYVFMEVSDSGMGMDEETRARIFEPFFTTKFTGRGLGLAAVQGIVRAHKGGLRVYSEIGRGTSFKVLLPAVDSGQVRDESKPQRAAVPRSGVVLVVDDESLVRRVTGRVLKAAGYEVQEAADGVEALEQFVADPHGICAVVLDMTMPRMGGEEAFRRMREANPDVRVVLTSGYNEQEATSHFVGRGHAAFLQKPFLPRDLLEALEQILGKQG